MRQSHKTILIWAILILMFVSIYSMFTDGGAKERELDGGATAFQSDLKDPNKSKDIESGKKKIQAKTQMPQEFSMLKDRLSSFLNAKVSLSCSSKGKGKISIPFNSEEDLERIMNVFDKLKEQ